MTFRVCDPEEQKKNRPAIRLDIYEVKRDKEYYWRMFRKYHYLNQSFHKAARLWLCYANGQLAGMASFMAFPHPKIPNFWKAHRIVVFPDFQGIGIANALVNCCAASLKADGRRPVLTSSNWAMIQSLKTKSDWKCIRLGRQTKCNKSTMDSFRRTNSSNRITAEFEYIGTPAG